MRCLPLTMQREAMDTESSPLIVPTTVDYLSARPPSFIHSKRTRNNASIKSNFWLWFTQAFSFLISTLFLAFVVVWAVVSSIRASLYAWLKGTPRQEFEWDQKDKSTGEKSTRDVQYYARQAGFDVVDEEVETNDGFLLKVHRVINPRRVKEGTDKGMLQRAYVVLYILIDL